MGLEIERKYLVTHDGEWRNASRRAHCRQGYLAYGPPVTVRVRAIDKSAYMTIKKADVQTLPTASDPIVRTEFEFDIPLELAEQLLQTCCLGELIIKTRHYVDYEQLTWEIDEFEGSNQGLILAEVELDRPDQPVPLPPWVRKEVTTDPRYFNASLAQRPFSAWDPPD